MLSGGVVANRQGPAIRPTSWSSFDGRVGDGPVMLGPGIARPEGRLDQAAAIRHALARCGTDESVRRRVRAIVRGSTIQARAIVDAERFDVVNPLAPTGEPGTADRMRRYAMHAPRLAARAAGRALRVAGVPAHAVTHVVVVSCTGFTAPGLDQLLADRLGLSADVERTVVGFMGCHGALNGLRVAAHTARAVPESITLVVAVELCSLHAARGEDPHDLVANALFADGAAAVVVAGSQASAAARSRPAKAPGSGASPILAGHGSGRIAGTDGAMSWRIGDSGFRMTVDPSVPGHVEGNLGDWTDRWLRRFGLERRDIGTWIVHPGGPRILDAAESSLGLSQGSLVESREVLRRCGNMSSPSVLIALRRARMRIRMQGRPGRRPPAVMLGLGPGLAIEATLLA